MASPAVATSLIDDINFMAELDNMESPDKPGGAFSIDGDLFESATGDEVPEGALAARFARVPETREVQSAKSARRVRTVQPATTPTRIEMPHQPGTPARLETRAQPERPVQPARPVDPERRVKPMKPIRLEMPGAPAHVDEIGKERAERAVSASSLQRVPALLAALTIVLCFSAGAGSAALVFHDRVAQITATWAK